MNAAPDHVVAAQFLPLGGQVVAATCELGAAVFETARAALHLGEGEQSGLVEVGEASAFVVGRGDLAVEAGQFGGEEFVVGSGGASGDGLFAGQQVVRVQQGGARSGRRRRRPAASARMLRSGQRRSVPPARIGSWLRQ